MGEFRREEILGGGVAEMQVVLVRVERNLNPTLRPALTYLQCLWEAAATVNRRQ